jgi:hypothetical protein
LCQNFNLARLQRVTLTHDLDAALAVAERRWKRRADQREFVLYPRIGAGGYAIEVMYRRRLRSEIFLDARLLTNLVDPGHPESCAANIVAHELAHVALFNWRDRPASSYVGSSTQEGWRHEVLRYLTLPIWDEYAACRLAARSGHPGPVLFNFMGCLRSRLSDGLPQLPRTRRRRWQRRDAVGSFVKVVERVREPLLTSAYLMGHIDGLGLTTTAPRARHPGPPKPSEPLLAATP